MSAPSSNGCLRALALGGALLVGGCQPPPGASAAGDPAPSAGGDTGSVALALTLPPAIQFASISYDLSGNGFHKASSIDVSKSSTFSTIVSGIPLGTGYTAELTAQDSAHKLTGCAGSATTPGR